MHQLKEAGTLEEIESIYRFRYRVFSQHLGRDDLDGLDHERRTLSDQMDAHSRHFYFGETGAPLVCLTFSPFEGNHVPEELSAFLALDSLREAVDIRRMGLINWLLVDPLHAGSPLVSALIAACYEQLLRDDQDVLLTFCRPGLVAFYERIGLEQYRHAADVKGIGLRCPLMLVMRDGARLRAARSPLFRILLKTGAEDRNHETRLRLEPIIDMFQAGQILAGDDLWTEGSFIERTVPKLFDGLDEDSIRQIIKMASVISCRPGEVITRVGETSDDMYLIVSGTFEAASTQPEPPRLLGQGDLFGEIEHLSGRPRREEVKATSPGQIAALKAERLFQWMQKNPDAGVTVAVKLARLVAGRLSA